MSTELKMIGIDPLEKADGEAVPRHAFHGEPLDPEVARRVHERAVPIIEEIRRLRGEIDDQTIHDLLRGDDEVGEL
jgi:hypothetical protein